MELTVSLVIGGIAVTAAAALFTGLSSRAETIAAAASAADRDANAERLLRLLVGNVETGAGTERLRGDAKTASFASWCEAETGWLERCRVQLEFREDGASSTLVLHKRHEATGAIPALGGGDEIILRRGVRNGRLLYLLDARNGGTWSDSWTAAMLPAAIAIVLEHDTLVLRVR